MPWLDLVTAPAPVFDEVFEGAPVEQQVLVQRLFCQGKDEPR